MHDIFIRSIDDYLIIQRCCRNKNVATYLLNNKIERFIALAVVRYYNGVL